MCAARMLHTRGYSSIIQGFSQINTNRTRIGKNAGGFGSKLQGGSAVVFTPLGVPSDESDTRFIAAAAFVGTQMGRRKNKRHYVFPNKARAAY